MNNFWKSVIVTAIAVSVISIGKGIYDASHLSEKEEKLVEQSVNNILDGVHSDMQKMAKDTLQKTVNL